ncbi:MAG TPA: YkvA family protein [Blastocatellia bacterium]|nr:YkvA family protein [Blastocatellia bacterium]
MTNLEQWKRFARRLKIELRALHLAYKDLRVPWYARVFAACVVGYAFSPIDLIPDPIPILGYLDDLILVPLGIKLALKMIPAEVLAECREKAKEEMQGGKRANWIVAAVIILIWLVIAALVVQWVGRLFN